MAKKIPDKLFYKIGDVCALTDTQPYVLRFWESEFPQLAPQKNRSGQRIYRKRDIEIVEEIKHLLYDQGYTIAGARKRLEQEEEDGGPSRTPLLDRAEGEEEPAPGPGPDPAGPGTSGASAPADEGEHRQELLRELREILRLMKECDGKLAALQDRE